MWAQTGETGESLQWDSEHVCACRGAQVRQTSCFLSESNSDVTLTDDWLTCLQVETPAVTHSCWHHLWLTDDVTELNAAAFNSLQLEDYSAHQKCQMYTLYLVNSMSISPCFQNLSLLNLPKLRVRYNSSNYLKRFKQDKCAFCTF